MDAARGGCFVGMSERSARDEWLSNLASAHAARLKRQRARSQSVFSVLTSPVHAWNVDGSSADKLYRQSWIERWEKATGHERGVCAYEGCDRAADTGGHVWLKCRGVYLVPICAACNYHKNEKRMQRADGKHSSLRKGTAVLKLDMTEEMRTARRRVVGRRRECEQCCGDITDAPQSHRFCKGCFEGRRLCEKCGEDISDRPDTHVLCYGCFCGRKHKRVAR